MNKTAEIVPMNFKCHSPYLDEMSRRSPFPLFRLSKVFRSSAGETIISPCGICKISYAMSITSVISYATVNIRSALSDGGDILHDLLLVISLYFFLGFYGQTVAQGCRRFLCQGGTVSGPLQALGIENQRGQLPMSECPDTQEMAKRHTHSCLLSLACLSV